MSHADVARDTKSQLKIHTEVCMPEGTSRKLAYVI